MLGGGGRGEPAVEPGAGRDYVGDENGDSDVVMKS